MERKKAYLRILKEGQNDQSTENEGRAIQNKIKKTTV